MADLLRDREKRGLEITLIVRFAVFAAAAVLEVAVIETRAQYVVLFAYAPALVVVGWLWWRLRSAGSLPSIGLAAIAVDLVLICALPMIWFEIAALPETPRAMIPKTNIVPVMILVIAVNTIPLRPLYPIVAALGALAVYLVLWGMAALDPRTVITSDFEASVMGPALNREMLLGRLFVLVAAGGVLALVAWTARRLTLDGVRLEHANSQLGRYFSPRVRERIATDAVDGPGGREQDVAVLFCDVRGFTGLAERLKPDEVMALLSDYQACAVAAVFAHDGTLDKYIGDAVMATFGTPEPAADDAERAVRAAIALRAGLAELNATRAARGLPQIQQGIGIHYGRAVVGNVGTPERLEYTAIGDTVNVASRLEAATKRLGEELIVSAAVKARLPDDIPVRALAPLELPGRAEPVEVFAVDAGGAGVTAGNARPDLGHEGTQA